jgi:hypothetical protein
MSNKLYVWVHSCPQRANQIGELRASLNASDVSRFEVRRHGAGLDLPAIREWWAKQWRETAEAAAKAGATHIVRLEDDVVVAPHLAHNVTTWPALSNDDFGVGLLFIDDSLLVQLGGFEIEPTTGAMRATMDHLACGQGHVIPVGLINKVMDDINEAHESMYRVRRSHTVCFDCSFTHAVHRAGKRIYVHVPSQVQTSELSRASALTEGVPQTHSAARTWDPEWRRPGDAERDVKAEHLWGYETRWMILNDGARGEVVPVKSPPDPHGPQLVAWGGRSLTAHPENLYATRAEAEAARAAR